MATFLSVLKEHESLMMRPGISIPRTSSVQTFVEVTLLKFSSLCCNQNAGLINCDENIISMIQWTIIWTQVNKEVNKIFSD